MLMKAAAGVSLIKKIETENLNISSNFESKILPEKQ